MGTLTFRYAAKERIAIEDIFLNFIRGEESTQSNVGVNYSNGTGQSLSIGQVLYSVGTSSTAGYLRIVSEDTNTLTGSGTFEVSVIHYPSTIQVDQTVTYTFDGTNADVNLSYNSRPTTGDVIIDKVNREPHVFAPTDFIYSDTDGDSMISIAIYGNVLGYTLSGVPYVAGTWVSVNDLLSGYLIYTPLDQDNAYDKDNTYKVKDINDIPSV